MFPNTPLPEDLITFHPTGSGKGWEAITAHMEGGKLVLKGQYLKLVATQVDANTIEVEVQRWTR